MTSGMNLDQVEPIEVGEIAWYKSDVLRENWTICLVTGSTTIHPMNPNKKYLGYYVVRQGETEERLHDHSWLEKIY